MPHEEMAAPAERDQVLGLELQIRRDVERDDVVRLEFLLTAADSAVLFPHEARAHRAPPARPTRTRRRFALDSIEDGFDDVQTTNFLLIGTELAVGPRSK